MRAQLRALSSPDVPAVVAACADWESLVAGGSPFWRPRCEAELRRKVESMSGPGFAAEYNFVIEVDGRLAGECSAHGIDYRNRVAQLGICLWSPDDRGRGIGQQATRQLISWATDFLGMLRLEAWIQATNSPSRRLFERLGFAHEGTLRGRYLAGGIRHDQAIYGRLVDEPQGLGPS